MMWNGSRAAWVDDQQKRDMERCQHQTPDDSEGLPPLAEGSRWERGVIVDADGRSLDAPLPPYETMCVTGVLGQCLKFRIANVRHLLARHDRSEGKYLPDKLRAFASELVAESVKCSACNRGQGRAAEKLDIHHRILSILDDVGL